MRALCADDSPTGRVDCPPVIKAFPVMLQAAALVNQLKLPEESPQILIDPEPGELGVDITA